MKKKTFYNTPDTLTLIEHYQDLNKYNSDSKYTNRIAYN